MIGIEGFEYLICYSGRWWDERLFVIITFWKRQSRRSYGGRGNGLEKRGSGGGIEI